MSNNNSSKRILFSYDMTNKQFGDDIASITFFKMPKNYIFNSIYARGCRQVCFDLGEAATAIRTAGLVVATSTLLSPFK